ncbi:MAG: hypothetical protein JST73_03050 [Actinobacteria bacterium]|nr:hypothetical protein [Actinomycetota bacterium]
MIASPPSSAGRAPGRARRASSLAVVLAALIVVSSACVNHRDPTSYSDSVRKNFVTGCTDGFKTSTNGRDADAAAHAKLCGCIYAEMTKKSTGIPFEQFKKAQDAIRANPTKPSNSLEKLIPNFHKYVSTCKAKVDVGPVAG